MKRLLLFFVLMSSFITMFAQSSQWTWINGDSYIPQLPVYGTQGLPAKDNKPGARQYATTWKDAVGNLWLFGGYGYGYLLNGGVQYLNDLWKYTPSTDQWTWISGDKFSDIMGIYGTRGIAASGNKPGSRQNSVGWTDATGNLWLFGGFGYSATVAGYLNDLWKFNPSSGQWTWVSGSDMTNQVAVYGTRGTAAAGNKPGARQNSVSWMDGSGNLWLFGGMGYANYGVSSTSDLWKYAPSTGEWTWVSGDTTIEAAGVYGTKGAGAPGNKPGARYNAVSWTDATGSLWLFGGYGYNEDRFAPMQYLNDLWKFSPFTGQWSWISGDKTGNQPAVYGTQGSAASGNKPGGRQDAVSWTDAAGNLWLHGGRSYMNSVNGNALDDLWKYDPVNGLWTWMNGYGFLSVPGNYGSKNSSSPENSPGSRYGSVSWADTAGNLWLSGGYGYTGYTNGSENDLWKYTISTGQWTWVGGDNDPYFQGVYGVKGTAAGSNKPGGRNEAATWTDASGNLWMFGGSGYTAYGGGYLNDLWKFTPSVGQWTWINGTSFVAQSGYYGIQGEPSSSTNPSSRSGSGNWTDAAGNLWMFGGQAYSVNGPAIYLNDVWKYTPSTDQWTWISGSNTSNQKGIYGTKGSATAASSPGARQYPTTWTDAAGNFWLFGGTGYSNSGPVGNLNDLWKYTPSASQWTWISGDSITGQPGMYNIQGISAAGSKPGARSGSTGWQDASGNLWLFGGDGNAAIRTGMLNDLWKYSTSTGQWAWMSGDSTPRQLIVYDPVNPTSAGNKPSSRNSSAGWTDASGNLWLFGGEGYTKDSNFVINLNDIWMYAPSTSRWTWKNYDPFTPNLGVYGTMGTASPGNIPGARSHSARWTDSGNKLWIFGGLGYAANGSGYLNDLWQYSMPATPLPVQFSSFSAQKQQQAVLLNWKTAQEQYSRYFTVERSSTGLLYDSIGSVAAIGLSSSPFSYIYVDKAPLSGNGYYRLKQVDQDGRFVYSAVAKIVMAQAAGLTIIQNPVQGMLQLNVELPIAQKLTLQIRDINGQLLFSRDYTGRKGSYMYALPVSHLGNGMYIIHMQTDNSTITKPFIKR